MKKQTSLKLQSWSKDRFAFGASLLKGSHPKKKRPFSSKLPIHLVMRSSKACGNSSFLLHNKSLSKILEKQSARHFVKIYSLANAGNHLHLIVQAPSREHLAAFLRAITGRIAQLLATHVCLPFLAAQASMHAPPRNQASLQAPPRNQASLQAPPANQRSQEAAGFWDARPFSRLVSWGKDFKGVARYIALNSTQMLRMSRLNVRAMFDQIQFLLKAGKIPKSQGLVAAGFV
jgi:REP element-mobilizing transposase RayT